MNSIPVNEPVISANAGRYVADCLASGWISSEGPYVRRFEEAFARKAGRAEGVAVCNGTAALELAVAALDLGPGDEVILPAFTIISCALAVVRAGAKPVVVDSHPDTWTLDPAAVEAAVTPRTRAIMPVHIYGLPADMDPVMDLAARNGLRVIEDASEAHGLTYKGRPCGSFGDLSTFSFYANKVVATGEGGMVVTDDPRLAERCRSLRNLCFMPERRFVHEAAGWNYRMGSLTAALGLAQVEAMDDVLARKRAIGAWYRRGLADLEGSLLQLPLPRTAYAENDYWVFGVVLNDGCPFAMEEVCRRLHGKGIGTRPFFWPLHRQPVFAGRGWFEGVTCPVAERLGRNGFYLPGGAGLEESQVNRVCEAVHEVLAS